jgi:hypothetical protein
MGDMNRRAWLRSVAGGLLSATLFDVRAAAAWPLEGNGGSQAVPVVGLNSHLLTPEAVAQLRDLGVRHVRTTLLWPLWSHPSYPVSFAENIDRAHRAGLRLLIVVHNWPGDSPVFSSPVSERTWRRFGQFVAARAAQFPQVEAWQLWNEQDLWVQAPFGASDRRPMVERGRHYARHLEIAYPLIKRANSRTLVVSGGTADHPRSGFLTGMVESRPPVDAIGIHAYGAWPEARERIEAARSIVAGHAPLWVTEAGQDHAHDAAHLAAWRSVIEGNARERLAARIYPYALMATGGEEGHGLLRPQGGTPRATYRWLREYLRRTR